MPDTGKVFLTFIITMSLTSAHLWLAPPNPGSHSILVLTMPEANSVGSTRPIKVKGGGGTKLASPIVIMDVDDGGGAAETITVDLGHPQVSPGLI
ncbi:hypothetical protein V2G26_007462 [Clonostachys chloroleuca]